MKLENLIESITRLFSRVAALEAENDLLKKMLKEKQAGGLETVKVICERWGCSEGYLYGLNKKYPGVLGKVGGRAFVDLDRVREIFGSTSNGTLEKKSPFRESEGVMVYPGPEYYSAEHCRDFNFIEVVGGIRGLSDRDLKDIERYLIPPVVLPLSKCLPTKYTSGLIKNPTNWANSVSTGYTCMAMHPKQCLPRVCRAGRNTSMKLSLINRSAVRCLATLHSMPKSN